MKILTYIRWVLVLPGAIFAGFLSTFPLHWILYLLFSIKGNDDIGSSSFFIQLFNLDLRSTEYLLYPCVFSIFFIIGGCYIAPKHKFKTALVLFGLYAGIWGFAAVLTLLNILKIHYEFSARTVLALVGAFIGLLEIKYTYKEKPYVDVTKNEI